MITQNNATKIPFAKKQVLPYLECPRLLLLRFHSSRPASLGGLLRTMCGCVVVTQNCI